MPDTIRDGRGKGTIAGVNSRNELLVMANSGDIRHFTNHQLQKTFSIVIQQTPSGANTCFLYIKNLDALDLTIWSIKLRVASAEAIEIYANTIGTAVGTSYLPVNLNIGSGKVANCSVLTNNTITGITNSSLKLLKRIYVSNNGLSTDFDLVSGIVVPSGTNLAFYAVTGAIQVDMLITLDYHAQEED